MANLENELIIEYGDSIPGLWALKELLCSAQVPFDVVENAKFHHVTQYSNAAGIMQTGLLSYLEKMKLAGKEPDYKELQIRSDEHFVNGTTYISLSKEGFTEDDLYPGEDLMIFNHERPGVVDIVISNEVKAVGIGINYLNEYLAEDRVDRELFRAVDTRLMDYFNDADKSATLELKIRKFNDLTKIALAMKESGLDIPLRHNGVEQFGLDIEKVSSFPVVRIRR